jgi:hypothetical protein
MLPPPAPPPKPRPADASKGVVLKLATTPARALLNKADEQSCAEPLPVPNEARQLPSAHISHLPADVRRMAGAGPYGPDLHVGKQRVRSGSGRAVLYCIKSGSGRYGRLGLGCAIRNPKRSAFCSRRDDLSKVRSSHARWERGGMPVCRPMHPQDAHVPKPINAYGHPSRSMCLGQNPVGCIPSCSGPSDGNWQRRKWFAACMGGSSERWHVVPGTWRCYALTRSPNHRVKVRRLWTCRMGGGQRGHVRTILCNKLG